MDARAVFLIVFGAIMALWPKAVVFPFLHRREGRLAELEQGQKEAYFEERRSLEAYPPIRKFWIWRLLGLAGFLLGLSSLLFFDRP